MRIRQQKLYLLILILSCSAVAAALGGGLFGQSVSWQFQWQHEAFQQLCHQLPSRSFWIAGQPMAVCSRCFGIYASFALSWILIPFIGYLMGINIKGSATLLAIALISNIFDVAGNFLGFWENTLFSRFLFGVGIGTAVVIFLIGYFINDLNIKKEYCYGYNRAIK
ncbi:putative membrane protein [Fodinibius salinus]|uniref:Putative membrane protein n=1 Tax=Fodinibius salinus TaxID=860790 RepID=A0A5D3YE99_9BACT|nr:DUF2085 domain-containing protein [Fodinibius salinus]TYP91661.1 putative membrane protein [Fodinibius salinus]